MFLYHFLWTICLIFIAPVVGLLRLRVTGCLGERLTARFALDLPDLQLAKGNIWVHALSVGEVVSAIPLIDSLHVQFPDKDIVFTVTTVTGMAIAREKLDAKVKAVLPCPLMLGGLFRGLSILSNPLFSFLLRQISGPRCFAL